MKDSLMTFRSFSRRFCHPTQYELLVKLQCYPRWWWLKDLGPRPLVQACPSSWKNLPQKSHCIGAPDSCLALDKESKSVLEGKVSETWKLGPWRYPILLEILGIKHRSWKYETYKRLPNGKNKSIWSPISLSQCLNRDLGKKLARKTCLPAGSESFRRKSAMFL